MSTKTSLNRKEDFWSWWCYHAWILFSLCFAGVMTAIILYYWNDWSIQLKGVAAISVILPIHVVEEWVFPGGFHYQYNTFAFHSDIPDRYPMCRVSDTITNLSSTFLFAGLALWCVLKGGEVPAWMVLMTIGLCILEVLIHTYFGVMAWLRFRSVGKATIYGVGSVTAYFCFGVLGVILCYTLADLTLTSTDWLWGVVGLLVMLLGCIISPEKLTKSRDTRFVFPSAGYYDRFRKENGNIDKTFRNPGKEVKK